MRAMFVRAGQGAVFGAGFVLSASVTWTAVQSWRDRNVEHWSIRRL
jgi:hypothetical protein